MPPCCCLTTTALLAALQNRRAGERDYEEVVAVEDLDHEVVGVMEEDLVDVMPPPLLSNAHWGGLRDSRFRDDGRREEARPLGKKTRGGRGGRRTAAREMPFVWMVSYPMVQQCLDYTPNLYPIEPDSV